MFNVVVIKMLKWSLAQLYKYNGKQFEVEGEYDFHDYIENIDDILDISIAKVKGYGKNVQNDCYIFSLHIECLLTLECARTLDPVPFPINLDVIERFDTDGDPDNDDVNIIEGTTIDLKNVVWENIYLEKPMRIFKEGTTEFVDQKPDEFYNEEDSSDLIN